MGGCGCGWVWVHHSANKQTNKQTNKQKPKTPPLNQSTTLNQTTPPRSLHATTTPKHTQFPPQKKKTKNTLSAPPQHQNTHTYTHTNLPPKKKQQKVSPRHHNTKTHPNFPPHTHTLSLSVPKGGPWPASWATPKAHTSCCATRPPMGMCPRQDFMFMVLV